MRLRSRNERNEERDENKGKRPEGMKKGREHARKRGKRKKVIKRGRKRDVNKWV